MFQSSMSQRHPVRPGFARLTRERVLDELARCDRPIGAHALTQRLSDSLGRRVAVNSVYRIIAALEREGAARRVESVKGWVRAGEGESGILRLVCSRCAAVDTVAAPSIARDLTQLARRAAYRPSHLVLELIGTCARCAAADPPARDGAITPARA